jgi:predicted NAD-dependent protein-ADP-ribosyltransferase YbiA (DUF1768 family)
MLDEMNFKPYAVTNSKGKTYGRYEDYIQAEKAALSVLKDTNYQERILISWFDLEYGIVMSGELLVA